MHPLFHIIIKAGSPFPRLESVLDCGRRVAIGVFRRRPALRWRTDLDLEEHIPPPVILEIWGIFPGEGHGQANVV